MTTEDQTDKPARAATRGPGFQEILDLLGKVRAENTAILADLAAARSEAATLGSKLDVLSALVQAALPAALVRLPWETVQGLIEGAPQTRLRLLAPFTSPMMNLAAGAELEACDDRVRKHGRAMHLGLATAKSDAPAIMVKRLLAERAEAMVAASKEHERLGRIVEAEAAQALADKLAASAGA